MKIEALHMSDAELEIMEYLWKEQKPVTAADIIRGLPHRKWKPSTVHTVVLHLIDEGFIKHYKVSGRNYYIPYISDFDYSFVVTKAFVNTMHSGSIVEIVRTLLCDLELNREELQKLCAMVNAAVNSYKSGEAAEDVIIAENAAMAENAVAAEDAITAEDAVMAEDTVTVEDAVMAEDTVTAEDAVTAEYTVTAEDAVTTEDTKEAKDTELFISLNDQDPKNAMFIPFCILWFNRLADLFPT